MTNKLGNGDPISDIAALAEPTNTRTGDRVLVPDSDGNLSANLTITVSGVVWERLYGDSHKVTAEDLSAALTEALGSWLGGSASVIG